MTDATLALSRYVRVVDRPPTWRGLTYSLSYILLDREPSTEELVALHAWAYREGLPNPRCIAPSLLRWSSLFVPRFFDAVIADQAAWEHAEPIGRLAWTSTIWAPSGIELQRFWLESVMFLAGVTLSAAIVQSRHSAGTIGSKFDRLWEAGVLADSGVAPELQPLKLQDAVGSLARDAETGDVERLLAIRRLFMAVLAQLAPNQGQVTTMCRGSLQPGTEDRFGFVDMLHEACGSHLRAVIAYGSSIASATFADYDVLLVVDDPDVALRRLAGSSPTWHGKELNVGVYSPLELVVMQRLSGDNLADYGVCLWGETPTVHKSREPLLARNFSFGVVRQRQQLGMLSRAVGNPFPADGDDRRNLHDYFVKIPANVAKGTFGALGKRLPKERVHAWMRDVVGFDATREQQRAAGGDPAGALAAATLATGGVLDALNRQVNIVHACPLIRPDKRRDL